MNTLTKTFLEPCRGRHRTGTAHWHNVIVYGTCGCFDDEEEEVQANEEEEELIN